MNHVFVTLSSFTVQQNTIVDLEAAFVAGGVAVELVFLHMLVSSLDILAI